MNRSKRPHPALNTARTLAFVEAVIGDDVHAKRVLSLANGTLGVIHSASLAVAAIGRGLAQAEGLEAKHAIKQVDRLLSNVGIDMRAIGTRWAAYMAGERREIVVAMDWTEFDADGQSTIVLSLITRHGRATPLLWETVRKAALKGNRNDFEDALLVRLRSALPEDVKITVLADRGFGDTKLYDFHLELKFSHITRFRGNIMVSDKNGVSAPAKDWLYPTGRARILRNVTATGANVHVDAVVCVWAKGMKEPWFLACGGEAATATASSIVKLYGRRFTIEENFRDTKDIRFGMGLSSTRIGMPERRDRLLLLSAFAVTLLTLLGAAAEELGYDRLLRANTVKRRTHSLFTQGVYFYGAIPAMKQDKLQPLTEKFGQLLRRDEFFREIFGLV